MLPYWARLKVEGGFPLRRGAWYRVTKFARDAVVLDVHGQPVVVPRTVVEIVGTPPQHWAVVSRPARSVMLPESWGPNYGVCPNCRHRAPLHGPREELRCPRCNGLFPLRTALSVQGAN